MYKMGNHIVVEASELINNACPHCGGNSLEVQKKVYTQNIDHELMWTMVLCDNCGNQIRILND